MVDNELWFMGWAKVLEKLGFLEIAKPLLWPVV